MNDPAIPADDGDIRLRRGWTTGACAAAAAKAAYLALETGKFPDPVKIELPGGQQPEFVLHDQRISGGTAMAAVEKDAGDDPDVTHGAIIRAEVRAAQPGSGIKFFAGAGVGTVTKPGLPLDVGEPAINPGPRQIIADNISAAANGYEHPDLEITLVIDGGAALAEKTWNPKLGILGGLSVLGTTGIVIPYSCSAWIASIHQAIDVARAEGIDHVAGCTGSTSEAAIAALYDLPEVALIDMGDFVGGLLKYIRTHPVPRLTIAGGFGKLSKLANGHLDLHSKRSQVSPEFLAELAGKAGADAALMAKIAAADTAGQILEITKAAGFDIGRPVARAARSVAAAEARNKLDVEVRIFDRAGADIGHAGFSAP